MAFAPEDISFVDIFPSINVARVGDSDEYFLGPEIPGVEPVPKGGFKDIHHRVKKQAARFRVYAYDKDSKVLGEIVEGAEYGLTWTVNVANKKSAAQGYMVIESGQQVVSGVSAARVGLDGHYLGDKAVPKPLHMGDILTDERGRLIVLPSDGSSFCNKGPQPGMHEKLESDGWVDSMCDGTVRVSVKSKANEGLDIKVQNKATIITAPPKFTTGLQYPTSLLDLVEEVYERQKRTNAGYDVGVVDYYRHIQPIFRRVYVNSWMNDKTTEGFGVMSVHELDSAALSRANDSLEASNIRQSILKSLRALIIEGSKVDKISESQNDNRWATLTKLQYDRLTKWASGDFITGSPVTRHDSFDNIPLQKQPEALTESAIEWSLGAPLSPGQEVDRIAGLDEMYNLSAKYRFADSVEPGDLGKGLSLPWQKQYNFCPGKPWWDLTGDDTIAEDALLQSKHIQSESMRLSQSLKSFNDCNTHWWPSADHAVTESHFLPESDGVEAVAKKRAGLASNVPTPTTVQGSGPMDSRVMVSAVN